MPTRSPAGPTFSSQGAPSYPGQPPPPPATLMTPVPGAPARPKTNPFAIVSLVCALAPLVLWVIPQIGFFATAAGAVLAIIFGLVAIHQINANPQAHAGKGLAIAGLAIGIAEIVLLVVFVIIVIIFIATFFAALGAACASCGGSTSAGLAAALRARGPERRAGLRWGPILRFATAHHPECGLHRPDVLLIRGRGYCLGCATTMPVLAVAFAALWALAPGPWWAWLVAGLVLGSFQFLSLAGLARTRPAKVGIKTLLGLGLAATLHGVLASPWPTAVQGAVLAAGWLLALACMRPRGRRIAATCQEAGHPKDPFHVVSAAIGS